MGVLLPPRFAPLNQDDRCKQMTDPVLPTKHFALSDVELMFVAYNIRRIINILGKNELEKYLTELVLIFSRQIHHISLQISLLKATEFID